MFIVIIHKRLPMKRSVHLQEVYFQVYSNMFEEVEIDGNFGCMTQDSFKKKKTLQLNRVFDELIDCTGFVEVVALMNMLHP